MKSRCVAEIPSVCPAPSFIPLSLPAHHPPPPPWRWEFAKIGGRARLHREASSTKMPLRQFFPPPLPPLHRSDLTAASPRGVCSPPSRIVLKLSCVGRLKNKRVYTLLYLKWTTSEDLLFSTWNSVQWYGAAWMGRGPGENGYMCLYG